jgi:hypothetical protein
MDQQISADNLKVNFRIFSAGKVKPNLNVGETAVSYKRMHTINDTS